MVACLNLFLSINAADYDPGWVWPLEAWLKLGELLSCQGVLEAEGEGVGGAGERLHDMSSVHKVVVGVIGEDKGQFHMYEWCDLVTIESTGIFTAEDIFLRALKVLE